MMNESWSNAGRAARHGQLSSRSASSCAICLPTGGAVAAEGLTLAAYAAGEAVREEFLRGCALSDGHSLGRPAVRIAYFNHEGEEVAVRWRLTLEGPERFRWRRGDKLLPYGLARL